MDSVLNEENEDDEAGRHELTRAKKIYVLIFQVTDSEKEYQVRNLHWEIECLFLDPSKVIVRVLIVPNVIVIQECFLVFWVWSGFGPESKLQLDNYR